MKNDIISYCDYYYVDNSKKEMESKASKYLDELFATDEWRKLIREDIINSMESYSRNNHLTMSGLLSQIRTPNNIAYDAITLENI